MKKILLMSVTLLSIIMTVNAQSPRFGINSGITLAKMNYKDEEGKENSDSRIGFNAGILIDIPIGYNFSMQPGVNFIQKGAKKKITEDSYSSEISMRINYLEVPVNLVYKAPVKKGHFFIGAGPSAGFALKGKAKSKFSDGQTTDTEESKLNIGNKNDDDLKRFELSLNALGGYEFNSGFQIAVNYNRSLNNLLPGDAGSASLRNSYFGIKIGYFLSRTHH